VLEHVMLADLRKRFAYVDVWLLNAASFGVPQKRKRLFLVAGPAPVSAPTATHGEGQGLLLPVSLAEGIGFDPWDRLEPVFSGYRQSELASLDPGHAQELRGYGYDDWWCSACKAFLSAEGGYGESYCWCPYPHQAEQVVYDPAPTLVGGSQRSHVSARSVVSGTAKTRERVLSALSREAGGYSVAEAAALHGFPVDWPFQGSNQAIYRQIANAVPPPLATAVGRAVAQPAWSTP
jgi:site-specific DNA-cytosine methylase